jgi:hypothetical protein
LIWQTKILSATRPKSNRPRSRLRPHPSQKKPRPPAAHPSSRSPVLHRRAARPVLRPRPIRPSRPNPRPIRPAAMTPRPRLDRLPPRRGRPASPNQAAGPPIHVPDPRRVAMHNAVRGSRPTAHRVTAGPLSRDRLTMAIRPTASVSSIRRPPTPSPGAAAVWWAPAALPAEGPAAAAGIITVAAAAAAPRGSSRDHALPATSRAASRTDRPAAAHRAAARPVAAILRGHRADQVGQAAIISRMASNRTQGHAAVDLPIAQALVPLDPARQ